LPGTPQRTFGWSAPASRSPTGLLGGAQLASTESTLLNAEIPGTYDDFVHHVVPILQQRGPAQRE
jgi:hypothetical protein